MQLNKYYIAEITPEELQVISDGLTEDERTDFVGKSVDNVRWNNDKTKCVIKIRDGVTEKPIALGENQGMTFQEIKTELRNSEWINPNADK